MTEIGIIGLGDMGRLYAKKFAAAGYRVCACDLPSRFQELKQEFADTNIEILRDGHLVSRKSQFIIYSVETDNVQRVVSEYGPSTKIGAVVGGQTSVKSPEIAAFEEYLPADVDIVTCHSMHAPSVDTQDQPLIIVRHRASDASYELVKNILQCLNSQMVEIADYREHDRITADTQVATHLAFLSMGTAWRGALVYPWENTAYLGGIDNVKVLMALRIYGSKSHVYSGLAMMNPSAKLQVQQYSASVSALFKLMIQEHHEAFRQRVLKERSEFVFGGNQNSLLLPDEILREFSLSAVPASQRKPNSHLSLLAMVDCWHELRINPYDHMICQTPPFRLRLGIAEYLFKNQELLEETLEAAVYDKAIRADDMEFYAAVREWTTIILHGDVNGYTAHFLQTQQFFKDRLEAAGKASTQLIQRITLYKNTQQKQ